MRLREIKRFYNHLIIGLLKYLYDVLSNKEDNYGHDFCFAGLNINDKGLQLNLPDFMQYILAKNHLTSSLGLYPFR